MLSLVAVPGPRTPPPPARPRNAPKVVLGCQVGLNSEPQLKPPPPPATRFCPNLLRPDPKPFSPSAALAVPSARLLTPLLADAATPSRPPILLDAAFAEPPNFCSASCAPASLPAKL